MTKAESGLVQFSTYIAYFVMALPAGLFMKKFGYKWGIILGLFLFALGAFAFIPAAFVDSAVPFLIALFVIACGLCFLETAANPYSTVLGPQESSAQRLNLSQSFNGLGWVLGPLVGGALIFGADEKDKFAPTLPYILVGSIVVVVAILFLIVKLPNIQEKMDTRQNMAFYSYSKGYKNLISMLSLSKQGVKLGFYKGWDFDDPFKIMKGQGKVHSHIEIKDLSPQTKERIRYFLTQALASYEKRK